MKPYTSRTDALQYLPCRPIATYSQGQVIYSGACDSLYLVVGGRVKLVAGPAEHQSMLRIIPSERFFGESCFVPAAMHHRAVALTNSRLMAWTRQEIEDLIAQKPSLGLALTEELTLMYQGMHDRLELIVGHKATQRVMPALLQLGATLGTEIDGLLRIEALPHRVLAEYAGTSREIVSTEMARLRRLGLIQYTRNYIIFDFDKISQELNRSGTRQATPEPPSAEYRKIAQVRHQVPYGGLTHKVPGDSYTLTVQPRIEASSRVEDNEGFRSAQDLIVKTEVPKTSVGASESQLKLLTIREQEVLSLVANGRSTKDIAQALGIAFRTVVCHRSHLMEKLDAHNMADLTRDAIRMGLIELPPASGTGLDALQRSATPAGPSGGCVANSGGDARAVGGTGFELRGDAKESVNELALSDHIALR